MTIPRPRPMTDPMSPITVASKRTERATWRRVDPRARKSASSRERWATRMLNVLMMRKDPDDERDAGEDQQEGRDEAERFLDVARRGLGGGVAGHGLDSRRQLRGHRVAELLLGRSVRRGDPDVVVGVLALHEERAGLGRVEDRQAGAGRATGHRHDADELGLDAGLGAGADDVDLLADEVAGLVGGLLVEDDLAGPFGPAPGVEREWLQSLGRGPVGVVGTDAGRPERRR